MSEDILFMGKNPEGRIFSLYGNKDELARWAAHFLNPIIDTSGLEDDEEDEEYYDEYSLRGCTQDTDGTPVTQEQRDADRAKLQRVLDAIANEGYKEIFLALPRKKNGSLAKNRVVTLWRGTSFQHYWEESYGFNAPELSVKAIDDYKAELQLTSRVVSY